MSDPLREAAPQELSKLRLSVQKEVRTLLDDLAPERPTTARSAPPDPQADGLKVHRAPWRCVLQGAARAVSVSWFPGAPGDESLGELLVILWRGIVSLPGSARKEREVAEPLLTLLLHPFDRPSGEWEWRGDGKGSPFTTIGLAAHCRGMLVE